MWGGRAGAAAATGGDGRRARGDDARARARPPPKKENQRHNNTYPPLKKNHKPFQVVLWDAVVESRPAAHLKLPDLRQEYPFLDQGNGLRGAEVDLTLAWHVMPRVGALREGSVTFPGAVTMPREYTPAAGGGGDGAAAAAAPAAAAEQEEREEDDGLDEGDDEDGGGEDEYGED
jgi:hypothetical protein